DEKEIVGAFSDLNKVLYICGYQDFVGIIILLLFVAILLLYNNNSTIIFLTINLLHLSVCLLGLFFNASFHSR
ncbi:MAG: hypothetical protein LBL58_13115, partial [Tannerellaceae bacterium]|nr:hypothetical protein [Tannerellaceae bacterium]